MGETRRGRRAGGCLVSIDGPVDARFLTRVDEAIDGTRATSAVYQETHARLISTERLCRVRLHVSLLVNGVHEAIRTD